MWHEKTDDDDDDDDVEKTDDDDRNLCKGIDFLLFPGVLSLARARARARLFFLGNVGY